MGAPTCLTCRSQYAYRNAGANPICLSKRGCELNLFIEPRALTQFPYRKRMRTQCAYRNAVVNSICLSKRVCDLLGATATCQEWPRFRANDPNRRLRFNLAGTPRAYQGNGPKESEESVQDPTEHPKGPQRDPKNNESRR